jgi:hypothetical protein
MKANVGGCDRVLRIIFGLVLLALGLFVFKSGVLMIVFVVFGALIFLTGLFRFCWLYPLLGINTRKDKADNEKTVQPE